MKLAKFITLLIAFGIAITPAFAGKTWVTQTDYPPQALREGRHGTTYITVTVGTDGRAHDCVVTKSSGSADLDEASCKQMQYARFKPATDDKGNPKESTWSTHVDWKLH